MDIEKKEQQFHEKLKKAYLLNKDTTEDDYITDGIINYSKWAANKVKLLVVLKEPNTGGKDGTWSLSRAMEKIAEGGEHGKMTTIEQIAKISRTLNVLSSNPNSDNFTNDQLDYSYLAECAIINIKKNHGFESASWEEIESFAKRYSAELKEQIELISPKLIYCGGYNEGLQVSIYNMVKNILGLGEPDKILKYPSITANIYAKYILLDAYHPEYLAQMPQTREDCERFAREYLHDALK